MVRRRAIAQGKWTRGRKIAVIAVLVVVGAMALASVYILRVPLIDSRTTAPAALLEPGWQFYTRPTSLEPPGTVFRIDKEGRRFAVAEIPTEKTTGTEAFGTTSMAIRTNTQILPKFIGGRADVAAGQEGIAWRLSSSRCSTSRRRSQPTWRSCNSSWSSGRMSSTSQRIATSSFARRDRRWGCDTPCQSNS